MSAGRERTQHRQWFHPDETGPPSRINTASDTCSETTVITTGIKDISGARKIARDKQTIARIGHPCKLSALRLQRPQSDSSTVAEPPNSSFNPAVPWTKVNSRRSDHRWIRSTSTCFDDPGSHAGDRHNHRGFPSTVVENLPILRSFEISDTFDRCSWLSLYRSQTWRQLVSR